MNLRKIKITIVFIPLIIGLLKARAQLNIDSLAIYFLVKNELIRETDIVYKKRIIEIPNHMNCLNKGE